MSSRAKKMSKTSHIIASAPNAHSETKFNPKKLIIDNKNNNGQCISGTPVKNAREKRISLGKGAVQKDNTVNEKSRLFYSSDEEPDDINNIFEQNVSKSIQSFPRKNSDMHFKERKFFKRNHLETFSPAVCLSPRSVELQEENVSKVFRMLSKPVGTPTLTENKSLRKLPLKTYSTPKTSKHKVIESFGLPDNPIVSSLPTQCDDLDVGITDAKDVTVFDLSFFEADEILPVKQYEKSLTSSVNNVELQDEIISSQKNVSPDHSSLIEKMKNQIRKLLSDSPTHTKEKSTSTPMKNAKSDKLACDISFVESDSLDMEIFNTSGKTDVLFSQPNLNYNKKKQWHRKKVDVAESEKFRQKLRSSESCDESDKTDDEHHKSHSSKHNKLEPSEKTNKSRSRLKKNEESKSASSSFSKNVNNYFKKHSNNYKDNFSNLESPNKSLELKILLNPLSESVLSNYSFHNIKDPNCVKQKSISCQQFLEYEQQNVFVPFETSIINKILGDWDNAESDFIVPKNKSTFLEKTPNKYIPDYEFNEISPDLLKEKMKYKKKCRNVVALLSEQESIINKPKREVNKEPEEISTRQMETYSKRTKEEKGTNYEEQNAIAKTEKAFTDIEEEKLNFSVIQYEALKDIPGASTEQEILIFETPNNLELLTNRSIIMNADVIDNTNNLRDQEIILSENFNPDGNLFVKESYNDLGDSQTETKSFSNEIEDSDHKKKSNKMNETVMKLNTYANVLTPEKIPHCPAKSDLSVSSDRIEGNISSDYDVSKVVINLPNSEQCLDIPIEGTVHQICTNHVDHQHSKKNLYAENSKYICEIIKNKELVIESEVAGKLGHSVLESSLAQQEKSSTAEIIQDNKLNNFGKQLNIIVEDAFVNIEDNKKKKKIKKQLTRPKNSIYLEEYLNMDHENEIILTENAVKIQETLAITEMAERLDEQITTANWENLSLKTTKNINSSGKLLQNAVQETLVDTENIHLIDLSDEMKKNLKNNTELQISDNLDELRVENSKNETIKMKNCHLLLLENELPAEQNSEESVLDTNENSIVETSCSSVDSSEEILEDKPIQNKEIKRKYKKKPYIKCRKSIRLGKSLRTVENEKELKVNLDEQQKFDSEKQENTNLITAKTDLSKNHKTDNCKSTADYSEQILDEVGKEVSDPNKNINYIEVTETSTNTEITKKTGSKSINENEKTNNFNSSANHSEQMFNTVIKESSNPIENFQNTDDTETTKDAENNKEIKENIVFVDSQIEYSNKSDNSSIENNEINVIEPESLISPKKIEMPPRRRGRSSNIENLISDKKENSIIIKENIEPFNKSEEDLIETEIESKQVKENIHDNRCQKNKSLELNLEADIENTSGQKETKVNEKVNIPEQKDFKPVENIAAPQRMVDNVGISLDIKLEYPSKNSENTTELEMKEGVDQRSKQLDETFIGNNTKELMSLENAENTSKTSEATYVDQKINQPDENLTEKDTKDSILMETKDFPKLPRKRGRPLKVIRKRGFMKKIINENIKIFDNKAIPDENNLEKVLKNASPKIFEGFEIDEQLKESKSSTGNSSSKPIYNIDLEQIEAELVAIDCQKEEDSYLSKLTRSKSRGAIKDFEREMVQIEGDVVKTLKRSKTSLGLLLKESVDSPTRSRGRQRITMDIAELETIKDKRTRSKSIAPIIIRSAHHKKPIRDRKEKPSVYKLGTLAWARIGRHPFWPCLVTKEPGSNLFKKDTTIAGTSRIIYHVRFFGDKGKRAWVQDSKLMVYNCKNDVEVLLNKCKQENKPFHERLPYIIRLSYLEKWQKASNEAEQLKGKTSAEKQDFFEQLDERRKLEKLARKNELPGTSKRKRKDSNSTICSDTSQITDFQDVSPTRKKYKKDDEKTKQGIEVTQRNRTSLRLVEQDGKINSDKQMNITCSIRDKETTKDSKTVEQSEPEPIVIPPYVPILDNENILPSRTRSGLQSDASSDIVSKVSSEKSDKSDVLDPFSIDAQRALFKRNNLFRGVSKEKACQYCYQAGMVFKCTKGGCNGLYHLNCSVDVMNGEEYSKRRNKKKASSHSTVIDQTPKENESNTSSNTETSEKNPPEDRVQIVTVTSHVYNTPPRKTFPENFHDMSLAEQIDYKMKEVMKKFENETNYGESSTDSSSEENSVAKIISRIKNSPSLSLSFETFTADKKSSEDSSCGINPIKPNGKLSDINRKSRISSVKHVTADSVIEMSSTESSPSTTRQSFMQHVTADFVTTQTIDKSDKGKTNFKKMVTAESDLERTPSESSCSTISQLSKEMVDPKNFKCGFCLSRLEPYCFVCHKAVTLKNSAIRQKCSLYQCGRFYHPECLKQWPQTQWSLIQTTKHRTSKEEFDTFVCPQHVCHTCSSDDPRAATSRCSGDKIVKCLRCPASYHSTNFCIPAGTEVISTTQVICPRHRHKNKTTINTTWCFLCSEGGNLICCETCPTSVHPECMPVNLTDDDKFICEDCESGRLPLYDEIVWVKLGAFRWWPALILFPNEVPPIVMNARHSAGEFVVRFFGTYDHYWVSRSRSFLFQDGDAGQTTSTKKKVDAAFNRAVEEAVVAHKAKKEFKRTREVESLNSLKPPPYIRIKFNKPVGNVRHMDLDLSSTTSCDCDPNKPSPCEPDSDCLNRLLMTECNPEVCPAGQRCKNQSFEKREYPPMTPYKTEGRGWGLKTLAPIKKGQFVIEYVGELIDMEEYQRRIQKMHEQKEENYYFLTIDKDRMIDAGPKGNMARFMNHCCQPNCETQKWTVNGDTRVGLFATIDIPAETELTFNYNLECVGKERKICRCGAPSCSGFIGVQKEKQDTEVRRVKKVHKKKKPVEQAILPPCFICQRKGSVGLCNNKVCNKAYHLRCLNMTEWPEGNTFICPRHNCNICEKRTIRCCVKCINSFCPSHSDGNIRYDNLLGFVCNSHDPTKPHVDNPLRVRARKSHIITEESAITSTTSDDSDKEDKVLLSDRLKTDKRNVDDISLSKRVIKGKKRNSNNTSDEEFEVSVSHSTSLLDVPDENLVSSASSCGPDEGKRKKSMAKRNDQNRKKIRLSNIVNNKKKNTARSKSNYRQLDYS